MNIDLSPDEISFALRHGIALDQIFDARGLSRDDWRSEIKDQKSIQMIIGASCRAGGHRIRSRQGHCLQCNPSYLTYQSRWYSDGEIYIAWSDALKLTKIGYAEGRAMIRIDSLNKDSYGGACDWHLVYWCKVREGGRIEN